MREANRLLGPVSQVVNAKEKFLKVAGEPGMIKKAKQSYCWYGDSFGGLERIPNQPQHSLKPKPNLEQGPNSLQFCEGLK